MSALVEERPESLRSPGPKSFVASISFPPQSFAGQTLDGSISSQALAESVPGARVVKAANTLGAAVLGPDPHQAVA